MEMSNENSFNLQEVVEALKAVRKLLEENPELANEYADQIDTLSKILDEIPDKDTSSN